MEIFIKSQWSDIDLEEMEHVGCGGMLFLMHDHKPNQAVVYWCMNCGDYLEIELEENDE